jgi:hypothetical protein
MLSAAILVALASSAEGGEPKYPFFTTGGAVLCPNPFALKEAKAALANAGR